MKVSARITIATSALITATLGVYGFLELRAAANERRAGMEQEARDVAMVIRASLEARNLDDALGNADRLGQGLSRAGTPWQVALLPIQLIESPRPGVSAGQLKRLRTILDVPDVHLVVQEGETFIYVVPLRRLNELTTSGYRIVGALEISRSVSHLRAALSTDMGRVIPVLAMIVTITILAVAGLSHSLMSRPVEKLLAGIDDVAQGDLSRVLLSERDDEIGALATRFNEMTHSLRESRAETEGQNEAKLQLEQRLSHTEKLATMGQLAAEIAHEVGTPLNVIAGRSRSLARKAEDPAAVRKNAAIISEQTARITRIIQRLLDFTRAKVGASEPELVDLNGLSTTTMELVEGKLTSAKVVHSSQQASNLPRIRGDKDRLQQVLLNLLLNAIQAMPEGGALTLQTSVVTRRRPGLELAPEHDYVVLRVIDSGIGIPLEKRDKIFEPFYTSKYKEGGTGLGLAICFGIVKEHDGWIEIDDAPGAGTVFSVYLPALERDS